MAGPDLLVSCIPIPTAPTMPSLRVPNLGDLIMAIESFDAIPDAGEVLSKFRNQIALALAPIRQILEIIEALQAINKCMLAIPEAITSLDTEKLFKCFSDMAKALGRVLAWIPPISYIRTGLDLMSFHIDFIDAINTFIVRLDNQIGTWVTAYNSALSLGDTDLTQTIICGAGEARSSSANILEILQFISPMNDLLMQPFSRLIGGSLDPAIKMYKAANDYFADASEALSNGDAAFPVPPIPGLSAFTPESSTPFTLPCPPLGQVIAVMFYQRNAQVMLYNLLAPFVGKDADKAMRTPRRLKYL